MIIVFSSLSRFIRQRSRGCSDHPSGQRAGDLVHCVQQRGRGPQSSRGDAQWGGHLLRVQTLQAKEGHNEHKVLLLHGDGRSETRKVILRNVSSYVKFIYLST